MRVRKLNRLRNWDYSKPGWYFVTICTQKREEVFGQIKYNKMILFDLGCLVKECLIGLKDRFDIELDEYVIMPNHVHVVIKIVGVNCKHCRGLIYQTQKEKRFGNWMGMINHAPTLGHMIRYFKAKISRDFGMQIWQRNYKDNPKMWERDRNNLNY